MATAAAAAALFSQENDEERRKLRKNSLEIGQEMIWSRLQSTKSVNTLKRSGSNASKLNPEQVVSIDILAEEWLTGSCHDMTTKLYLVERLLPVLVLGLEKLLILVGKRGLEEQVGFRDDFNPVNILAQYLMRNNPRHRHCVPVPSPYFSGLTIITARLRKIVIEGSEGIETRVKNQLMEERSKHMLAHKEKLADEKKKRDSLKADSLLWSDKKGIPKLQVQQVILAWLDEIKQHPQYEEIKGAFANIVHPIADVDLYWSEQDFIDSLLPGCLTLKFDTFMLFSEHLHTCGKERKRTLLKEKRMTMFKDVFEYCDAANLTLVDRQQLLSLLHIYYENAPSKMKDKLVNPKTWVVKWDDIEEVEENDDWERESSTVSDDDYQQFMSPSHHVNPSASSDTVPNPTEQQEEIDTPIAVKDNDGSTLIPDPTGKEPAGDPIVKEPAGDPVVKEPAGDPVVKEPADNPIVKQPAGDPVVKEPEGDPVVKEPADNPIVKQPAVLDRLNAHIEEATAHSQPDESSQPSSALPPVPTGPGQQWSPKHIALPQFLELCNLFMGENPEEGIAESLATFIRLNYHRDELDLGDSSEMQRTFLMMKRAQKINAIFTQWDINCSGFLSIDELETVLGHWEGFNTYARKRKLKSAIEKCDVLNKQVSKNTFSTLMDTITEPMGSIEFRDFTNFVVSSIKMTHEQQKRSGFRQQLLAELRSIGDSSSINLIPALESGVKTIQQDSIQFTGKPIGVCIALLDYSNEHSSPCLTYKAASDDCIYNTLGKKLFRSTAPISFSAIETSSPVHVPDVHKHGKVHFFIPSHSNKEEYAGSLVVVPIITPTGQVIGTISVDSVAPHGRAQQKFTTHEISFYQGVGVCLGEIYQSTVARRRLIGAAEAGIIWLLRRCPSIVQIDFYLIKKESPPATAPSSNDEAPPVVQASTYTLQHTLTSDQSLNGQVTHCTDVIKRKDNFFRDYLFQCVDTSETVSGEAYCYPHLACPLRDPSGCAVAVIDFTISQNCNGRLQPQDLRDVGKMVKLLTAAFHQAMIQTSDHGSNLDEDVNSITVLFHKLLLTDLQSSMKKINKRAFAELRSYIEPPSLIYKIVKALILILYPQVECNTWAECKHLVTINIVNDMGAFQPTPDHKHSKTQEILQTLKDIPPLEVYLHGSLPAKYLFNWVSACSTVLEHTAAATDHQAINNQQTTTQTQ